MDIYGWWLNHGYLKAYFHGMMFRHGKRTRVDHGSALPSPWNWTKSRANNISFIWWSILRCAQPRSKTWTLFASIELAATQPSSKSKQILNRAWSRRKCWITYITIPEVSVRSARDTSEVSLRFPQSLILRFHSTLQCPAQVNGPQKVAPGEHASCVLTAGNLVYGCNWESWQHFFLPL